MIDLSAIEKRLQQSTQGLWGGCLSGNFSGRWAVVCTSLHPGDISISDNLTGADSAFTVWAHDEDIPILIAEVKRLREEIIRITEQKQEA